MESKRDTEGLDNWLSSGFTAGQDEASPTDKSPLDDLENAVASDSRHYGRDIDLVPVARYQRSFLISFAVAVALLLIGMVLNMMMGDSDSMIVIIAPIALAFVVNLIWGIACKFRLAIALENQR